MVDLQLSSSAVGRVAAASAADFYPKKRLDTFFSLKTYSVLIIMGNRVA